MRQIAFLDRDGVLVRAFPEGTTTRGPRTLDEIEYLPGVQDACELLRKRGFWLVIVTNQPDVARGVMDKYTADIVTATIANDLFVPAWYACYHDRDDECACRKPKPGMLWAAAVEFNARLRDSILFGDRPTDGYAAQNASLSAFYYLPTNGSLLERVTCALAGLR